MPKNSRAPRVVWIGGGWPADGSHLEAAGRDIDLCVYHSRWLPNRITKPVPAAGVACRAFAPVVRTDRAQLAFVFRGLERALHRDNPDVVHVVCEPWGLLSLQAARWVIAHPHTKLVVHGCDTIWHHGGVIEQRIRKAILRQTMPAIDAYAAENGKALSLARDNGLSPSSVLARIHTNPRDERLWRIRDPSERIHARRALGLDDNLVAVGLLGRLVPEKGIFTFLDSVEMLIERRFPGRFFVAGDGPLSDELNRRKSPNLVPLGSLEHPHGVLQFLQALDVLTCPSLATPSWEDQGPRSVLEAMMCGCIPVATPTGALPEMLGGHGVLAQSAEPRALADAIFKAAELATNDRERTAISSWAHSKYSGKAVAKQLVALWRDLTAIEHPLRVRGRTTP